MKSVTFVDQIKCSVIGKRLNGPLNASVLCIPFHFQASKVWLLDSQRAHGKLDAIWRNLLFFCQRGDQ